MAKTAAKIEWSVMGIGTSGLLNGRHIRVKRSSCSGEKREEFMHHSLSNLAKGKGLSMYVPNEHDIPPHFDYSELPRNH